MDRKFPLLSVLSFCCALGGVLCEEAKDHGEVAPTETPEEVKKKEKAVPAVGTASTRRFGGEDRSVVQVANLIYARVKSSQCFSDHFLIRAEKESAISTNRRFHAVKLASEDLFSFPLVIMTGEGDFRLTDEERKNLRQYLDNGGFLLASAGCSSKPWDRAFRREIAKVFPKIPAQDLDLKHPVFHTVYDIKEIKTKCGKPQPFQGIVLNTRLAVLYSPDGLNDTAHTTGCCCCGGNEILNSEEVNINILAYTLVF